jgi:hypothetical protein
VSAPVHSIRDLADTVLFEGYMLYPYRANDPKNRVRWQFGVLAPPAFAAADSSERSFLQADCLIEGADVEVSVLVRFLHVQQRTVQLLDGDGFRDVDSLDVGDATFLPWDEAVVHESETTFRLADLDAAEADHRIRADAAAEFEALSDADGSIVGRLARARTTVTGTLSWTAEPLPGPYRTRRLRLRLDNTTPWTSTGSGAPDRPDALRHALVAAHLVLSVRGGAFVSMIDTPEWASGYTAACEQIGAYPILAGPAGDRSIVLVSPIILYDHPEVAPESVSQFCDATEMDEMLTLRTLTLTEEEKRFVRGSDARGAALVDEIDNLPPELMDRLHGAIRSMRSVARPAAATPAAVAPDEIPPFANAPFLNAEEDARYDPATDVVMVQGVPLSKGASVRLRPGTRRTDAQDMFLDGRMATVEAVLFDLDGLPHLAVSLDDLVELSELGYNPHGRFLYFAPDEVEPMKVDA